MLLVVECGEADIMRMLGFAHMHGGCRVHLNEQFQQHSECDDDQTCKQVDIELHWL